MKVKVKSGFKILKGNKKIDYPASDKELEISKELYHKIKEYVEVVKEIKGASN